MRWNAQGQEVADNDPEGIYDERPAGITPPAPPAEPPVDSAVILSAYQEQLRATANRAAEAERRLQELETRNNQPAAPSPEQERQYFDTPIQTTRTIVQEELQRTVGPINQFIQNQTRQQTFAVLKQQMRESGRFPHLAKIESVFDQMMQNVDPTAQTMMMGYQQALGIYISNNGRLDDSTPASNDPPPSRQPAAPVNKPLPPHASPSAPVRPAPSSGTTKVRTLSEQEKIIKRHNGYKHDAQYLYWTEYVKANEVAHITPEQEKADIKRIFGVDI